MDFRNIDELYMTNYSPDTPDEYFNADVMQIRQGSDILWSRRFDVDIRAYPEGYGTITPSVNGKHDYKSQISFSTTPVGSNKFIEWSDGETSRTHSKVTISGDYSLYACYESPGIDYYDSEEDPRNSSFTTQLNPGTYEIIVVGAGGKGGRSNDGGYGFRGAAGGGSGAVISGYVILEQLSTVSIYRGRVASNSYVKGEKRRVFSIIADGGSSGSFQLYHATAGSGGLTSQCETIGLQSGYLLVGGNDGKSVNNGSVASGGKYAVDSLQFGGGQISGLNVTDETKYPNKGTGYPPPRGYVHIERVYTVDFRDYDGKTIKKYVHVRRNTSCEPPSVPTRQGYDFSGWSSTKYQNVNQDAVITATYTANITLTTRPNDSTFGTTAPSQQTVSYGDQVQVVATPYAGYKFVSWSDGGEQTHTVILTENVDLTANFDYDGECP